MISTQIPGQFISVLFNMSEFEEELSQVDCSVCPCEYLTWILVDLGFPVLTPPWMEAPKLVGLAGLVKRYHEREVHGFVTRALQEIGYSGQELLVTTRGRVYCAISFSKE